MTSHRDAARSARLFLMQHVRDNWEWPPTERKRKGSENRGAVSHGPSGGTNEVHDNNPATTSTTRLASTHSLSHEQYLAPPTRFQARTYGSSTTSSVLSSPWGSADDAAENDGEDDGDRGRSSNGVGMHGFKFDSPDSVADTVRTRLDTRRRRRRARVVAEMQWNDGLACWVRRRDAWTGAVSLPPDDDDDDDDDMLPDAAAERKGKRKRPAESSDASDEHGGADGAGDSDRDSGASSRASTVSRATPPAVRAPRPGSWCTAAAPATHVPVAAPLLVTNPIRAAISPRLDAAIFEQIVLSDRAPQVPINLADMTRALVAGWRARGEWPGTRPNMAVPQPEPQPQPTHRVSLTTRAMPLVPSLRSAASLAAAAAAAAAGGGGSGGGGGLYSRRTNSGGRPRIVTALSVPGGAAQVPASAASEPARGVPGARALRRAALHDEADSGAVSAPASGGPFLAHHPRVRRGVESVRRIFRRSSGSVAAALGQHQLVAVDGARDAGGPRAAS